MLKKIVYGSVSLAVVIGLAGCSSNDSKINGPGQEVLETIGQPKAAKAEESRTLRKMVDIFNTKGKRVGTATFTQQEHGVLLQIYAEGLKPGRHGFHIHETGKCEPPKFESSGAHFNPTAKKHGFDNPAGYHAGDIANLIVDSSGHAAGEFHLDTVTLVKGQANSLLDSDGSALVIHSGADDYSSEPSGNSGKRVACGVIK